MMQSPTKKYLNGLEAPNRAVQIHGHLSGELITVPDVNSGYPLATLFDMHDETPIPFDRGEGHPDTCSSRLKIGVLVPATNCTVEAEMWTIVGRNASALEGIGLHCTPIETPTVTFGNPEELSVYRRQFDQNILKAVDTAMLAEPQYLVLGFSMEHFSDSPEQNEQPPQLIRQRSGVGLSTWSDASQKALQAYGARRIALLCPFDRVGLANAVGFFENRGFEVVSAVGLGCASGTDVGHIPDDYKEHVVRHHLLNHGPIDAIVQCGSNLSSLSLAARLEANINAPLIGINAATLWYALREFGITAPLHNASRLLREH